MIKEINKLDNITKEMKKDFKKKKPEKHVIDYVEYFLFNYRNLEKFIEIEKQAELDSGYYNPKVKQLEFMKEVIQVALEQEYFDGDDLDLLYNYYFVKDYERKPITHTAELDLFISNSTAYEIRRNIINKVSYVAGI